MMLCPYDNDGFYDYHMNNALVHRPGHFDGFSWSVSLQGKARLAANGRSLCQRRNVALEADRPTLRALLSCPATALPCLTRETPLPAHGCLVAEHDRNAEPINMAWTMYSNLILKSPALRRWWDEWPRCCRNQLCSLPFSVPQQNPATFRQPPDQ